MPDIVLDMDESELYDEEVNSDTLDQSDDELDEETRELMYKTSFKNIDDIYNIKEPTVNTNLPKKINNTPNKTLSLSDFNKQVTKQEPTKFVSKRVNDKKKDLGVNNMPTRQFNPRLQPYNLVYRRKETNNNNLDLHDHNLFPNL